MSFELTMLIFVVAVFLCFGTIFWIGYKLGRSQHTDDEWYRHEGLTEPTRADSIIKSRGRNHG